jgi:sulfate transport system permease protein
MVLCNARAMGEFGAVSVVAGNIDNGTNTMPLQIYQYFLGLGTGLSKASALASLLLVIAALTLVLKTLLEWRWLPTTPVRRR